MRVDVAALRAPLLRWYRKNRRDLPWRRTSDPYAIWVSEAMLQQTTVAAVVPYWERFLARYPSVEALARASEEEVLASWTGLGYYRRARALRLGAIAVMERHGGRVPSGREELLALPGIGPYTAGAIASVAFSRPEPVVDGNVRRVFSRLRAEDAPERSLWELARMLVRGRSPGDLNQALMELGATVCTPRAPNCDACPWEGSCLARRLGRPESYPEAARRTPVRSVRVEAAWIDRGGKVLLARASEGSPLRGAWDIPAGELGPAFTTGAAIARVSHTILSRRLEIEVVEAKVRGRLSPGRYRWVAPEALAEVATSAATTKIVRAVYAASSTSSSGSRGRVRRNDFPSMSGTAPKATSRPAQ